ncbi:hypothetical protein DFP97_12919 [Paenibacillus prosopidis]|uniref:Uncharacterized protein n=1 Tax=Paenibacillus prosopidis TaxID=630520 RepID=A0A368VI56_9BACL|nr:hypothetical protein DFP97_12919 [Paenibacillus prosopidis]
MMFKIEKGKLYRKSVAFSPLFQLIACQYLIINGYFIRWYT